VLARDSQRPLGTYAANGYWSRMLPLTERAGTAETRLQSLNGVRYKAETVRYEMGLEGRAHYISATSVVIRCNWRGHPCPLS
jgi:hypothetical protein